MLATAHKSYMETFSEETTTRINRRIASLMNNDLRGLMKKHKMETPPMAPEIIGAIAAAVELGVFDMKAAKSLLATYF